MAPLDIVRVTPGFIIQVSPFSIVSLIEIVVSELNILHPRSNSRSLLPTTSFPVIVAQPKLLNVPSLIISSLFSIKL